MQLPFAELPGGVYVNIATTDTFTHGWDLAKATGQSTDLDPELATQLLAFAQGFVSDASAWARWHRALRRPRGDTTRGQPSRRAGGVPGAPGLTSVVVRADPPASPRNRGWL